MSFDKHQFRDFISRTLKAIDLHSEQGVDLLMKTAAKESNLGMYLKQIGRGPALGVFQMEPETERNIWNEFLKDHPQIAKKITELTGVTGPNSSAMEGDLRYQTCMARVRYLWAKGALPDHGDTEAQAHYWKKNYNTVLGDGTVEEFIAAAKRYT